MKILASMNTRLSSASASSVKGVAPQRLGQLAPADPKGAPPFLDQALTGSARPWSEIGLERGFQQLVERLALLRGAPLGALEQSVVDQCPDLSSHGSSGPRRRV